MKKSLSVLVVLVMLFACFASFTATASADPDPAIERPQRAGNLQGFRSSHPRRGIEDDEYPS